MAHDCFVTAYHEAGHAVIASVLGMPLEYATIRALDLSSGHVRLNINSVSIDYVIVLNAGRIAQSVYNGSTTGGDGDMVKMFEALYYLNTGAAPFLKMDNDTVESIMKRVTTFLATDPIQKQISEHTIHAQSLVSEHWAAIDAVAMGLIEQETLNANDIQRLITHPDKAPRNPYGWGLCKECRSAWHKRTKRPGYEDMIQLSLW